MKPLRYYKFVSGQLKAAERLLANDINYVLKNWENAKTTVGKCAENIKELKPILGDVDYHNLNADDLHEKQVNSLSLLSNNKKAIEEEISELKDTLETAKPYSVKRL